MIRLRIFRWEIIMDCPWGPNCILISEKQGVLRPRQKWRWQHHHMDRDWSDVAINQRKLVATRSQKG